MGDKLSPVSWNISCPVISEITKSFHLSFQISEGIAWDVAKRQKDCWQFALNMVIGTSSSLKSCWTSLYFYPSLLDILYKNPICFFNFYIYPEILYEQFSKSWYKLLNYCATVEALFNFLFILSDISTINVPVGVYRVSGSLTIYNRASLFLN